MSTAEKLLQALQAHNLKRQPDGSYRCNSPLRPGADSMSFTLTIEPDGEHGAFYDHVSDESGSLYVLAKRLSVPLPPLAPAAETKRAYTGLQDYARAHGAPVEAYEKLGWKEVTKGKRRALEIPTETGTRWRYLDGNKPVFTSPPDYRRCWYGRNADFWQRVSEGKPVVITNGEPSVVAAQYHGLAACCVTSGEKEIPTDLMTRFIDDLGSRRPPVIIALDCDDTGRKAALAMESQFKAAGFEARAVNLRLGRGGDLADFCKLYTTGAESELLKLDQVKPPEPDKLPFRILSVDDIRNLPPIQFVDKERHIPRKSLTMVVGAPGAMKTFFALDKAYKVSESRVVVYIVAEGFGGMRQRLGALERHYGRPAARERFIFVTGAVDFFDAAALGLLASHLEPLKPELLIVDTLAMVSGDADENHVRDMRRIIAGCSDLSERMGLAVLLVHHTNKEGREPRGSSSLRASVETLIRLTRIDDAIEVECLKSKDSETFPSYTLRPVKVRLGYTDDDGQEVSSLVLLPADQVVPDEDTLTEKQRAVLEAFQVDPTTSINDLAKELELSRGGAQRVVKNLTARGYLTIWDSQTNTRELTPAGTQILDCITVSGVSPVPGETQKKELSRTPRYTRYTDTSDKKETGVQGRLLDADEGARHHYREGL